MNIEVSIQIELFEVFPQIIATFVAFKTTIITINDNTMAKLKGAIVVDTARCKGCVLCVAACPQNVIALSGKVNVHGYPYVEAVKQEACVGCASCGIVCPDGCITVYRKRMED